MAKCIHDDVLGSELWLRAGRYALTAGLLTGIDQYTESSLVRAVAGSAVRITRQLRHTFSSDVIKLDVHGAADMPDDDAKVMVNMLVADVTDTVNLVIGLRLTVLSGGFAARSK